MARKRLAKIDTTLGRVITGYVDIPVSHDYFNVSIISIENPTKSDWNSGEKVKISKKIVERIEYLKDE